MTLRVQLAPAVNELPHALVLAKSPALAPLMAMLVMVKVPVPVFVSVTD